MIRNTADWIKPEIIEGQDTKYGWRVAHVHKFILGDRVDIGYGCYIMAAEGVSIGSDAQLGSHCSVYSISTIDDKRGPVVIKKGARIGSHTIIMPGVTIGEGAVIGAHSLVKQDVPDGETWFGVPAKPREMRHFVRFQGEDRISCRGLWAIGPGDIQPVPGIMCGSQGAGPAPSG